MNKVYYIPLIMAFASAFCGILGSRMKKVCGLVATLCMFATLAISLLLFKEVWASEHGRIQVDMLFPWIVVGDLQLNISFLVDSLTSVMLLVVSFVGSLIFVYANGYMKGHERIHLFFCYFSLFACAMYILVLGDSLPLLFVGWEGVGLCSYLLIGFYREEDWCNDAGRKAFVVNRIGDFGFLLGMFILFWATGTLSISGLIDSAPLLANYPVMITLATLLLFVGATGKSAQIPLFVWLPDAMAGPTPVSALIHAATMVTAGVYMVVRMAPLFVLAPLTLNIIAIVGGATALMAGFIAITQNDIKKVLAYSTVSQLGYMFLALGCGAFSAAIFHLFTHAFFKGCLFLCAGSVIHALHHEQDMRNMGGLRKKMPWTFITFAVSGAALAGLPPLAGSISKDAIIENAFVSNHHILWIVGVITALMTAFYTFRAVFMTFFGEFRGGKKAWDHLHESPMLMTLPLMVLAAGAAVVGFLNVPAIFSKYLTGGLLPAQQFSHYLERTAHMSTALAHSSHGAHHLPVLGEAALTLLAWGLAVVGVIFAGVLYLLATKMPGGIAKSMGPIYRASLNKLCVDEFYNWLIIKNMRNAAWFAHIADVMGIDGIVNGLGSIVQWIAAKGRKLQSGQTQTYALGMFVGALIIIFIVMMSK
jgi:NADH-quinone oxidoreductase subunit L